MQKLKKYKKNKKTKRQKTKRQKDKDKRPKREFYIVTSGQFRTLAMFQREALDFHKLLTHIFVMAPLHN